MSDRKPNILVVEDEIAYVDTLRKELDKFYRLIHARTVKGAQDAMQAMDIDLVLLDLVLEEDKGATEGGLKLLPLLKKYKKNVPIIIVSKQNEFGNVRKALTNGAEDFFWKDNPVERISDWKLQIDHYLAKRNDLKKAANSAKISTLKKTNQKPEKEFLGESESILNIKKMLAKLANKPKITVLLTGETGVGKEVAAEYMHRHGARKDRPFKPVNLSTLTKNMMESRLFGHKKGSYTGATEDQTGLFEEANGGILFLDEIGEVDSDIQKKILRFLQEKVITPIGKEDVLLDVQIVGATNRDLKKEVAAGNFREDLYYRIYDFEVNIPPLRDRRDDIPLLLEHYLDQDGKSLDILSEKVRNYLFDEYPWPGNVRELVSWVRSTCLKLEITGEEQVPESLLPRGILKPTQNTKVVVTPEQENPNKISLSVEDRKWQENAALEELKPIEIGLLKYGRKGKVGEELGLSMDQIRYKVKKYYRDYPEIFDQLPEITKKYKLK